MTIEHSKTVADELAKLLAESYTLYLKTHKYHWNVTGPNFHSLHQLLEQEYTELATAVDEIAERIRALGQKAPGSYAEFGKLSEVHDDEGDPDAETMLANLARDHRKVAERANDAMKIAGEHEDEGSAALANDRISVHEKAAWMLSAHLG